MMTATICHFTQNTGEPENKSCGRSVHVNSHARSPCDGAEPWCRSSSTELAELVSSLRRTFRTTSGARRRVVLCQFLELLRDTLGFGALLILVATLVRLPKAGVGRLGSACVNSFLRVLTPSSVLDRRDMCLYNIEYNIGQVARNSLHDAGCATLVALFRQTADLHSKPAGAQS